MSSSVLTTVTVTTFQSNPSGSPSRRFIAFPLVWQVDLVSAGPEHRKQRVPVFGQLKAPVQQKQDQQKHTARGYEQAPRSDGRPAACPERSRGDGEERDQRQVKALFRQNEDMRQQIS